MNLNSTFRAFAVAGLLLLPSLASAQTFTDDFNRADGPSGPDWATPPFGIPAWTVVNNEAYTDVSALQILSTEYCGSAVSAATVEFDFHGDTNHDLEVVAVAAPSDFSAAYLCQTEVDFMTGDLSIEIRSPFTMTSYDTAGPVAASAADTFHLSATFANSGAASCSLTLADGTPLLTVSGTLPTTDFAHFGMLIGRGDTPDSSFAYGDNYELALTDPITCPGSTTTTTTTTTTTSTTTTSTTTTSTTTTSTTSTTTTSTTTTSTTTTSTTTTTTTTLPGAVCQDEPRLDCQIGADNKSSITLKDKGPGKGKLAWTLGSGAEADPADFGNPVTGGIDYAFCLYDDSASAQPLVSLLVDPVTGWTAMGSGFGYANTAGNTFGVTKVKLKPGSEGHTVVAVQGKGANFAPPLLPLTDSVTAQLIVSDGVTSTCWSSTFSASRTNTDILYSAKGPSH